MPGLVKVNSGLKAKWAQWALLLILMAGAALRFYGNNWDSFLHAHPDERWISMVAVDISWPEDTSQILHPRQSPLNPLYYPPSAESPEGRPRNFAYGHLPLYLLSGVASLLTRLGRLAVGAGFKPAPTSWLAQASDYDHINLVGRLLSALFDTGTIYLTYLLGKRVYGRWVALLGAAFVAFTVTHIQLAHFYAFDTVAAFFVVLAVYGAVMVVQGGGWSSSILAGAAVGLAVSSKFSAIPLLAVLVVAHGMRAFVRVGAGFKPAPTAGHQIPDMGYTPNTKHLHRIDSEKKRPDFACHAERSEASRSWLVERDSSLAPLTQNDTWGVIGPLSLSLGAAFLAFSLTSPFAILDFKTYLGQIQEQGAMVRGVADFPYTRQYRNTLPFIYQLEQQLRWGMGRPLGLVAFAGFAFVSLRALLRGRPEEWTILTWVVPYFLITGSFMVKFMRYMLPLLPFFCLMGAELLFTLKRGLEARYSMLGPGIRHLASKIWYLVILLVLGCSAFYSLAFVTIYSRPHTWIEASRWIYDHVPDGSVIAVEHWDDQLPKSLPEPAYNSDAHRYQYLTLPLYEDDNQAKYNLIINILRQADYIILASNRLYRSIPRLPERYPLTTRYYDLLFAGELGFKLERAFTSYPQLLGLTFVDDEADESFTVYDHPKPIVFKKERDLSDEEFWRLLRSALPGSQEKGAGEGEEGKGEKSLLLDRPVDELPVVDDFRWNALASRSSALAVLTWWLALEILGLLAWPLAFTVFEHLSDRGYILAKSLGLLFVAYLVWLSASLRLLRNTLPITILALCLLSFLSFYLLWRNRGRIWAFWKEKWLLVTINEALFTLAFLLFVGIRLLNPDLWQPWLGGEKMMEFAFLNAILKSPYFPPYDPYFAGGYINYYYYGQFIVTVVIKLTGIEPSVAFNLAIPMLFALTVANAFCVGYNLMKGMIKGLMGGLLTSISVAVLGNLDGMLQIIRNLGNIGGLDFQSDIPGLEGLVRAVPGVIKVLQGHPLPPFDYWAPTRVIPFTINEFPFFSFLFADLHPHMIAIPFTILFGALALNLMLKGNNGLQEINGSNSDPSPASSLSLEDILGWAVIPLCLGALAVINTWDLPTYLGLILCAFALREYLRLGRIRWVAIFVFAAFAFSSSLLLYWPFFAYYQTIAVGLGLVEVRTDVGLFLAIWGFFLFVTVTFLLVELSTRRARLSVLRFVRLVLRRWGELPHFVELYRALVRRSRPPYFLALYALGVILVIVVGLVLLGYGVLAILIFSLALTALLLLRRESSPEELFTCLLISAGFFVLTGCELFYMKDFLGGSEYRRMNTLFKFYIQVWVLLGLATGSALSRLWDGLSRWRSAFLSWTWMLILAFLLSASFVYPVLGTGARVVNRFPEEQPPLGTLDGMAYMTVGSYTWPDESNRIELEYDYEAIHWLLENVKGTPVIAEAILPYYREGGMRVSSYTGLPTLLGAHQSEQRYAWQVGQRDGQGKEFYNTPDISRALELIRELDLSYIYVGKLERTVYDPAGLGKFDQMAEGGYLRVVFQNEEVRIYEVIREHV